MLCNVYIDGQLLATRVEWASVAILVTEYANITVIFTE